MAKTAKTAKKKTAQLSDFQLNYEKVLLIAAFVLACFHMTLVSFRYVVDYKPYQPYERRFGMALFWAAVIYLILTIICFPNTLFRIKALFRKLACYEQFFMIGLVLWSVVSCWYYQSITGKNYVHVHEWHFFDTAVSALILLPMAKVLGKEKAKHTIELLLHIVVGAYTIFTLWSLWNIFHLNIVTLPSGGQIGMDKGTRLYMGYHYNVSGAIALTMFGVCLYMIFQKGKALRAAYLIAAAAHLVIVMLSNSRTVFIAGLVMIAAAAFLYSWNRLAGRNMHMRIGISIAAAVFFAGIFWAIRLLTFSLFERITHFKEILNSNKAAAGNSSGSITDDVRDLTTDISTFNNRSKIWAASLKVMFSSVHTFFFGVTLADTTSAITQFGKFKTQFAHAHNAILQVGVAFGVPAMIAFIVFHVFIFLKSIRILFVKNARLFPHAYMVPVVVLSFVVVNLAEAYLVGYYAIMSSVFFLFCGWIMEMDEES